MDGYDPADTSIVQRMMHRRDSVQSARVLVECGGSAIRQLKLVFNPVGRMTGALEWTGIKGLVGKCWCR